MEYVLGPKDKSRCVFCVGDDVGLEEMHDRLVVVRTREALVMLNRYPFAAGHLLVIPKSHVSDLEALSPGEHAALFDLLRESVSRLKRAVRCEGVNVGINLGCAAGAGIAEHLHAHVVPRWSGDTNFMPVIAESRIVPQSLDATRRHLAPFFEDLAADE